MKEICNKILIRTDTRKVYLDENILGILGENKIEKLVFSFTDFVDGIAWLEVEKLSGAKSYIQMDKVDESYEISVLNSLLDEEGYISLQVRITITEDIESPVVFKSEKFDLKVKNAINATEEVDENYPEWIDIANAKMQEVDNLDISAKKEGNKATITVTKKDNSKEVVDIFDGEGGSGGTTDYNDLSNKPSINGIEIDGDKTLEELGIKQEYTANEIAFEDGETFQQKYDSGELKGKDGIDGKNGLDGKNGTNGTDGKDGYTPIKDVDYFDGKDGTNGANGQDGKNYSVEVVESEITTLTIEANKFYKFEEVAELNITLADITDNTQLNEFMFEFISGETATTLTLPDTVKWIETPSIEANKTYQCSIVNNIGVLVGVDNV